LLNKKGRKVKKSYLIVRSAAKVHRPVGGASQQKEKKKKK